MPKAQQSRSLRWPYPRRRREDLLEAALSRCAQAIVSCGLSVDDVEVFWLQRERTRWLFDLEGLRPQNSVSTQTVCRVARDGQVGQALAQEGEEFSSCFERAFAALQPAEVGLPGMPGAMRPVPMALDDALVEQVERPGFLRQLADAMLDNTRHEAERIEGLARLEGQASFSFEQRVIGRRLGTIGMQRAHLRCAVALNQQVGEYHTWVAAPESWLNTALMGARLWRALPTATPVTPDNFEVGPSQVVLHPRVFEQLLRPMLLHSLRAQGPADEQIAGAALSVIDDPGLGGFATSCAFDDEGLPTRRRVLVQQGVARESLRLRQSGGEGGGAWRDGEDPLRLRPSLSTLLVERGEYGLGEVIAQLPVAALVQEIGPISLKADGSFQAPVRWGSALNYGQTLASLAPGEWCVRGHLWGERGLFAQAELGRELLETGTAALPYVRCTVQLGAPS